MLITPDPIERIEYVGAEGSESYSCERSYQSFG